MANDKVISLGDRSGDNTFISVKQMLEDALTDDNSCYRKGMILLLNDEDGEYTTRFYASNISATEMIALMRVMEKRFMDMMEY
jgi:hypothetical protein